MHRPPGDHTAIVVCSQHPARMCLPDNSGIGESVIQRVDPPCVEACPQGDRGVRIRWLGGRSQSQRYDTLRVTQD